MFLHSVERADLCFLALPALSVRGDYELVMSDDDLELLDLAPEEAPVIGKNVAALAVISLVEGEAPTVNLLSPVVIDLRTRRAVQAIRPDDRYTCREPLLAEVAVCS
jgi:flagellar assembly factor FliW